MKNTRISELIQRISQADQDYYNKAKPTLSDQAYDALKDELRDLISDSSQVDPALFTQALNLLTRVGAEVDVSQWKKVQHQIPMTSLNKALTPDEFKAWVAEVGTQDLFLTEKLDGMSLNTFWHKGILVEASTRGSGAIGENITVNVRLMQGIPQRLNHPFTGNLRGEVILNKSNHQRHFSDYVNTRNAAAGIAKRYDAEGVDYLNVIFYQVLSDEISFETEKEQFQYLESLGVKVPYYQNCSSVEEVLKKYSEYHNEIRENLKYDIDGLVIRVSRLADQEALGEKAHRPAGAIAFKFDAEARESILRKIVWQTGSTGRITPVAEFDTVELTGANVSRASLYNYSNIRDLELDIGAKILVARSGDVIPIIVETIESTGTTATHPTQCPECGSATHFDGEYLICPSKLLCPAQKLGRLQAWINTQNILDWSEATLQRCIDAGLVNDVADLYQLTPQDLEPLERMGKRLAKKLIDIIDSHRQITLQKFVGGLGINGIAASSVDKVVQNGYTTLEALKSLTVAQLEAMDGFGSIKAKLFCEGLKENEKRIEAILAAGVSIKETNSGKLNGKSFCFTGSAQTPRAKLFELVEENGGVVKKSIVKGLDFLVIADPNSTSTKAEAARKNRIKLISEAEFLGMLK